VRLHPVYPIVNIEGSADVPRALALVDAVLSAGATLLQLRAKTLHDRQLLEAARQCRHRTRAADALFLINDRPDIALLCDADGVHVGTDDLPVAEIRQILGPDAVVGCSTDTPDEAHAAVQAGASYIAWGSVYRTGTKTDAAAQVGPAGLVAVRQVVPAPIPLVAIGGIGGIAVDNVGAVAAAGADAAAVVGALAHSDRPGTVFQDLLDAFQVGAAHRAQAAC
jgi:thiamine-phosphate pyrophosphorylase